MNRDFRIVFVCVVIASELGIDYGCVDSTPYGAADV